MQKPSFQKRSINKITTNVLISKAASITSLLVFPGVHSDHVVLLEHMPFAAGTNVGHKGCDTQYILFASSLCR